MKLLRFDCHKMKNAVTGNAAAVAALILAATAAFASGCAKSAAQTKAPPPPPEVLIALPEDREFTPFEEFTGRIAPAEEVEIRGRVGGYLDQVLFDDGAEVKKGKPLFVIDQRTYQAEVNRAVALIAQAQAKLDRMNRQVERAQRLLASRAISSEEAEQWAFEQAEAAAALRVAEANKALAELQLGFTTVSCPVDGRIGRHQLDTGNMVRADDTLLATVVTLNPVHAYFEVDERTVLKLRRTIPAGAPQQLADRKIPVDLALVDEAESHIRGVIDFADNELDTNTGTLRVRATVPNDDLLLSPGLFIRCRMPIGGPRLGVSVPEEALASDQGQRFLYVLNQDDEVNYRRVVLGPLISGRRIIESGLKADERVVVAGHQRIRNGQKVKPKFAGTGGEEKAGAK